ncbi:hypothetical protein TWF569_002345 [Orbilia oligospora]|uniref:Cyanovirin-N domain-containing protein n=1 Tax=Orbilia oligospora TaxID=2813651 RepID=A0A7C8JC69_ORBOL|nr:hypothetical protein TWF103_011868 [Orbilia oligospora]KAF3109937.1 hypothetical protein TWF102_009202 [Orbilia oligospora]KAF3117017.1 hypothetical protein TWF706_000228 [Orbilia oligospora]KAF3133286.1 hypothetical protein TWF594_009237 [Orbilia oligospora]KAF3153401.1 hypothetical protein TWF569_002345 [Orbilia oligospora]
MRSIGLVLNTFFFILAADLVLAKWNWGSEWKNSKLDDDRWQVSVEPTGQKTGWYQLSCKKARGEVRDGKLLAQNKDHDGVQVVNNCEKSCRCNMFGEVLLNPLAAEICNNDTFLKKCMATDRGGLGCKCTWIQQPRLAFSEVASDWLKGLQDTNPGEKGDSPIVNPTPPHKDRQGPGFQWFNEKEFRKL